MKERKLVSKTYTIFAYCECGGDFLPTGMMLTSYPPQYPHVCNKCGKQETAYRTYPAMITETEETK